ncbi:isopenicillin N synthase family dioxygenase [Alloalcanivorax sp. C16-1]|uniref:isopenicillin N synthase family dioxygenase n=1 Tax=Alloalcanivorax sp. C16-1 TaxID=3390051 RepID=UPI00397072EE
MIASIPVIDLALALRGDHRERVRVAREIDAACTEVGFFTIRGHGVPVEVIDRLRDRASRFFNLPLPEKLRAQPDNPSVPRGYRAIGFEALSHGNTIDTPPDLKEYYHFGRPSWPDEPYYSSEQGQRFFVPNRWPDRPSDFADAAADYYRRVETLAEQLMELTALALGLDEQFFADKIDRHITAMRINFYPEQKTAPEPGQLRAGEHTDYGLLTILNGENKPGGLQVQVRDGEWIPVETAPDTFVVNIGDLLMRWTNDRWVSNVHRVVNPPASAASLSQRISIGFFHHPNYDALIESVASPGEARYPPVLSGEYRDEKYRVTRS